MKNKFYITMIAFIFVISLVGAYESGKQIEFTETCLNNGTYCSSSAVCNITISYPNGTIFKNNIGMQNQASYHNYTLEGTVVLGTYKKCITCTDGALSDGYCEDFKVTPSGSEDLTEGQGIIIGFCLVLILILGVVFFITSNKSENKIVKIIFLTSSIVTFVIAVLFTLLVAYQTLSSYPLIIDMFSDFWFILEILLGIGILAFVLYIWLFLFKLYKLKRGLIDY